MRAWRRLINDFSSRDGANGETNFGLDVIKRGEIELCESRGGDFGPRDSSGHSVLTLPRGRGSERVQTVKQPILSDSEQIRANPGLYSQFTVK